MCIRTGQTIGQRRLQDIVAERRFRFAGHFIRLPQERPAHCAMDWTPEEGRRKRGRPKKTWRTTFKEDLQLRGISRCEVEAAAVEHTRCRYLAAHCPTKDRRNYVLMNCKEVYGNLLAEAAVVRISPRCRQRW